MNNYEEHYCIVANDWVGRGGDGVQHDAQLPDQLPPVDQQPSNQLQPVDQQPPDQL